MKAIRYRFIGRDYAPPVRRWIVPELLAAGEVTALVGQPNCGKSMIAARLATDVASGERFLGLPTTKSAVLYVAAERGDLTARRLKMTRHEAGIDVALSWDVVPLADEDAADTIIAVLAEIEAETGTAIGLLIIDTLAVCSSGLDENSQRDMSRITSTLQRIAAAGPAVLVLHHLAKQGGGVRGSSVLTGAFDRVLEVSGYSKQRRRTIEIKAANDGEPGAKFSFAIESIETGTDDVTGAPLTVGVARDVGDVQSPEDTRAKTATGVAARSGSLNLTANRSQALECLLSFGTLEVSISEWKNAFYAATPDMKGETQKKNFRNARKFFKETGLLCDHNHTVIIDGGKLSKMFPDFPFFPDFPASEGGKGGGGI